MVNPLVVDPWIWKNPGPLNVGDRVRMGSGGAEVEGTVVEDRGNLGEGENGCTASASVWTTCQARCTSGVVDELTLIALAQSPRPSRDGKIALRSDGHASDLNSPRPSRRWTPRPACPILPLRLPGSRSPRPYRNRRMHLALALCLAASAPADGPAADNLDFHTGTLAGWEGDGFVLAPPGGTARPWTAPCAAPTAAPQGARRCCTAPSPSRRAPASSASPPTPSAARNARPTTTSTWCCSPPASASSPSRCARAPSGSRPPRSCPPRTAGRASTSGTSATTPARRCASP